MTKPSFYRVLTNATDGIRWNAIRLRRWYIMWASNSGIVGVATDRHHA